MYTFKAKPVVIASCVAICIAMVLRCGASDVGTVGKFSVKSVEKLHLPFEAEVSSIASSTGRFLAVASWDPPTFGRWSLQIELWDIVSGKRKWAIHDEGASGCPEMAMSFDDKTLLFPAKILNPAPVVPLRSLRIDAFSVESGEYLISA